MPSRRGRPGAAGRVVQHDGPQPADARSSRLENLSRVQQRFVSDVSHELRTPLTTIRMAGDLLHEAGPTSRPGVPLGRAAADPAGPVRGPAGRPARDQPDRRRWRPLDVEPVDLRGVEQLPEGAAHLHPARTVGRRHRPGRRRPRQGRHLALARHQPRQGTAPRGRRRQPVGRPTRLPADGRRRHQGRQRPEAVGRRPQPPTPPSLPPRPPRSRRPGSRDGGCSSRGWLRTATGSPCSRPGSDGADTRIDLAGIVRARSGLPQRLAQPLRVGASFTSATSIASLDDRTLAAIGSLDGKTAWTCGCRGSGASRPVA